MTTLKITAKGQVTLRQDILAHLGVGPKQKIEVEKLPHGRIMVRAAEPRGAITDFIGCLAKEDGPVLSLMIWLRSPARGGLGKNEDYRRYQCAGEGCGSG